MLLYESLNTELRSQTRIGICFGRPSAAPRRSASHDLIHEGDVPSNVHLVLKGIACRYKLLPDGTRAIMALLLPGDFCDLHVSILGEMDHNIGT